MAEAEIVSKYKPSYAKSLCLLIRRHKTTIFIEAEESSTVLELKRMVEGILRRPPEQQRLYKDDQLLDDGKTLAECGFTSQTALPHAPATVGLVLGKDAVFEALCFEPFSSTPGLQSRGRAGLRRGPPTHPKGPFPLKEKAQL